jgi:predicted HicB family RNase H-like nuclease
MEYKGFLGSVHYNDEDELLYGKVMFIRALVSYEGTDAKSIKANFHQAVEDYLELCAEQGRQPERALKGSFNVRTSPDLHRRAAIYASEHSKKLNNVVEEALERFLESPTT